MRKFGLLGSSALRSAAVIGFAAAISSPVYAQDTAAGADDPATLQSETELQSGQDATVGAQGEAADEGQAITVTGSRIRRPNLESTVPITSIGGEQFFQQADTNIGENLNELPQLRSTFSQQNPGLGIGIAGLNLLDLRGLGVQRTLVLVNGRRHVAADILNTASSVDVNTIPNDLIERVDIVTGGNSAVYGSDAVAGVVNFVLRRNFEGLQLRGQAGISDEGFGGNQYVSAMFGRNFGGDRGNVTLHGEFSNQDRVFGSQIPHFRTVNLFGTVDVDPAGLPNGSDGFPDAVFLRDVRSASTNRFGLIAISQRDNPATTANEAQCGVGAGPTNGPASPVGGIPANCRFQFTPDGQLIQQTGTIFGSGPLTGVLGGNGQTGREGQLFSVLPVVKRYNFNMLAHYEFSDAFEVFGEGKWVRVDARGNNAAPSFFSGALNQFDIRERIRLDNPFLTPAQRGFVGSQILASGCNNNLTTACQTASGAFSSRSAAAGQGISGPLNAADIAAINAGTYRFALSRQLTDVGIRDESFRRDTYRIVGGVRGTFNEDWNYEAAVNYGRFDQTDVSTGYLDRQRFLLSLDAGRNPVTGQIQCRSQFDPAAAVAFDTGAFQTGTASRRSPSQQGRLASDIAACVPYNPFGSPDNRAAAAYFTRSNRTESKLTQFVASGFVGGDLSQLFELPGGPIRFALGAEYRKEVAEYLDDPFVREGNATANTQSNTNQVVIGDFLPPALKVKEAFGEIQIPVLKEVPFFHELTLSAAGRVSDYNFETGTVYAYNAGVDWAPVRDLRLRGNYSRAVRAPNLFELFFPSVPNFAPNFLDPCNSSQIANNPNRQKNCTEQLGADVIAGLPTSAYSLAVISGSNPNLTEETSDSFTVGGVFQPRFIPGLSLSVDYYDIKVKDVIVSLAAQTIINNCYDQPSLDNIFCTLFQRYTGGTPGPDGETRGQVRANTTIQAGVNFASRKRRGIDLNLAYRADLTDDLRLNTNLIWTHNLQISNFQNPALPKFENRILSELGDPKNEFRWDVDLTYNEFTFGYRMHYIGPMFTSLYENFNELESACTTAGCPPLNLDAIEPRIIPATFYHDVRFEWNLNREFQFYVGADNVLDTKPPFGITGTGNLTNERSGDTAAIFDPLGRRVYAGFRARF